MDISPTAYEELRLELNQTKRRLDELDRKVSLLVDCEKLEKAEPKKTEEASSAVDAWLDGDGCYISNACRGAARDAWFTCVTYLKAKHDQELLKAFFQGAEWENFRPTTEFYQPKTIAMQRLYAGTLGKP